jgi:hypothetical protein
MRILRLFPLALIAVSARADLYTLADSGIGSCGNYGGPFRQVGTSYASIDISSCTFSVLRASSIQAVANAGTGYLAGHIEYLGDEIGAGPSAIASFDFYAEDTTATALDLAFLITGSGRALGGGGSRITGTLSLSLNGAEFDDTLVSLMCCMHGTTFTLDDLANFHITGLPAGIATVKLSVKGELDEGFVLADILATEVPVPEPSSVVLLFSCLIAAGAPRIFRRARQRQ